MNKDHEEAVRDVRFVGESLIKNAESIVGNEEFFQVVKIHVTIDSCLGLPRIVVERDFIPERSFETFELENDDE